MRGRRDGRDGVLEYWSIGSHHSITPTLQHTLRWGYNGDTGKEGAMFARVLLCSDGSEQALKAAGAAAEVAKRFGGHITALHVFQVPVAPVAAVGAVGLDSAMLEPPNEG